MTQLQYLEDLIDLKVKSVSDIPGEKGKSYAEIEKRVMKKYKAPSLPAYILYEYHFKYKTMTKLAPKLGVPVTTFFNLMRALELPTRSPSDIKDKGLALEKLVWEKYNIRLDEYLHSLYHKKDYSLKKISQEVKRDFGIKISRQTINSIMQRKGIKRRTLKQAAYLAGNKKKKNI